MPLIKLSALCASVMLLAGCLTPAPVNVRGLQTILGKALTGVKGKTNADQEAIDIRDARERGAGLWRGE